MLNPGCKNCTVKNCDTLQYRGSRCAALRDKLGLGDPAESTPYDLEYKGVRCVEVNWEKQVFTFVTNGKKVTYKQPNYIDSSADTDHIRMVIELYLDDLAQKALSKKQAQDVEDAKAIIRLFVFADENTSVWRFTNGELFIGVHGCWTAQISRNIFPNLPAGRGTTLKAILNGEAK